jgi:hypothetical protein
MTDIDDVDALMQLELRARALQEKGFQLKNGSWSSWYDQELGAAARSRVPREDQMTVESVDHTVLFLRDLFRQHDMLPWYGDGQGNTDIHRTGIIIESGFCTTDLDTDLNKPYLQVIGGPGTMPETVIGSLKHWDRTNDIKTFTGLSAGTIQILCKSNTPAQAVDLANFVAKAIRTHWQDLCHQRWHSITEISYGGYDDRNPMYSRSAASERNATCPLTFTFFHQWTTSSSPRPGTLSVVNALLIGLLPAEDGDGHPLGPPMDGVWDRTKEADVVVYGVGEIPDD